MLQNNIFCYCIYRKLYWIDAGHEYKIESSTMGGEERGVLISGPEVGKALCFTVDHQEAALYWVVAEGQYDTTIKKYSLVSPNARVEDIIRLPAGFQQQVSSIATYQVGTQLPPVCWRMYDNVVRCK